VLVEALLAAFGLWGGLAAVLEVSFHFFNRN